MIKYKIEYPLDSSERTLIHRKLISSKKFLRKLYEQWYDEFIREFDNLPNDVIVELGSGGGFLKELVPKVICSDLLELPTNDMTFSALDMPFEDCTAGGIFMIDTMHHIPNIELFFNEVNRVLAKNGKIIMIEPANSLWGRFIYRNFHHESFDTRAGWTIPEYGPLSGANGALPWIVFERDKEKFVNKFPRLKLESISYRNPLLYLISGGVSYRQLLPEFMYSLINMLDHRLPKISRHASMFQLIKLIKI